MIKIRRGETVQVTRVIRDGSEGAETVMPAVENTAFGKELQQMASEEDTMRGRRVVIERKWFCPRGADVRMGDRITRANGEVYMLITNAFADLDHPLSGSDLGVMRFLARTVQAPRG